MLKKLLLLLLFMIAVSTAAQPVDTTNKTKTVQTVNSSPIASTKAPSVLKKQQRIIAGTTTWSKIKDLFN